MMTPALALLPAVPEAKAASAGRLKQSAARWCYAKIPLDDLCRQGAEMGLSGIDLVNADDWPTLRKYGLTPAMTPGAGTIPVAWNRKENHDRLEKEMRENIAKAAEAKVPNVITFSGNRRGLADDEGRDNCILGLQRVKKVAEEASEILDRAMVFLTVLDGCEQMRTGVGSPGRIRTSDQPVNSRLLYH